MLGVPAGALIKAMPVMVEGRGPVLVLVRGDHRLNEIKLQNALGRPACGRRTEAEVSASSGPRPGFIGPVGARGHGGRRRGPARADGLSPAPTSAGNHLSGVEPGRDFETEWADVRARRGGRHRPDGAQIRDRARDRGGQHLQARHALLGAARAPRYLDEEGSEQLIWMGSYGIGPARILAAAIEQFADENGIAWPRAIAPFDVELVTLGKEGEEARTVADRLYDELREQGLDVLYDDRDASAGEKFADAELLGCPLRLTVGKRGSSRARSRCRCGAASEKRSLPLEGAAEAAAELWREPPLTRPAAARPGPLRARRRPRRGGASRCIRGRSPTRSASRGSR